MDNQSSVTSLLKNKWVRIALIVNGLIIVAMIAIAIINARKTATIMVSLAPIDAEVTLGGKTYKNGAYQIVPGEYEATISREGLNSKTFTINVAGNSVTNLVTFLSDGNNFDYYAKSGNYESFYALSQIAAAGNNITTDQDKSAESFITWFQNAYNLYQSALPINYTEYENLEHGRSLTTDITIKRTSEDCAKILCIDALILTTDGRDGKALANELMTSKGLKLEDYEIKYKLY